MGARRCIAGSAVVDPDDMGPGDATCPLTGGHAVPGEDWSGVVDKDVVVVEDVAADVDTTSSEEDMGVDARALHVHAEDAQCSPSQPPGHGKRRGESVVDNITDEVAWS